MKNKKQTGIIAGVIVLIVVIVAAVIGTTVHKQNVKKADERAAQIYRDKHNVSKVVSGKVYKFSRKFGDKESKGYLYFGDKKTKHAVLASVKKSDMKNGLKNKKDFSDSVDMSVKSKTVYTASKSTLTIKSPKAKFTDLKVKDNGNISGKVESKYDLTISLKPVNMKVAEYTK
ncbi:hypothetical protein [Companilactobacillus mishanensis]|uniref:hypothetical protein n=1 Tax=Companilactobacillus mishanensis TaxID=2486008 RepID=UPI001296E0EB|nr:hypothetical protein [Companilactobacillus mishanensis]MQS89979.1 hypothetical protein [Companilactobacillus mishanensis]